MKERRRSGGAGNAPLFLARAMVTPDGNGEGRRRIRRRGAGGGLLLVAAALGLGLGSVVALCPGAQQCGDGVVHSNETCDDSNTVDGDGCSSSCMVECGFECQGIWAVCSPGSTQNGFFDSSCRPLPGDGLRVRGEPCDDGNLLQGDGCQCNLATRTTAARSRPKHYLRSQETLAPPKDHRSTLGAGLQ